MSRRVFGAVLAISACGLAGTSYFHLQAAPLHPQGIAAREAAVQAARPAAGQSPAVATSAAVLGKYCITCHNERLKTAGLVLEGKNLDRVADDAETWEKVVGKVRAGAMPPAGVPRPDDATYRSFASWLEGELDRAATARPNPGRPVVHRLNRFEYTNAIRDLLAVEVDGRAMLPTDESGYGFDNIGNVLSISSGLLDRYMNAAQKISRLAIGEAPLRPGIETYNISRYLVQHDRMSDDLPFGTRGGAVIRHYFPSDGEYRVKIGLGKRFDNDAVQGLNVREDLDLRLDGVRISRFTVGGECVGSKEPRCIKPPGTVPASEYQRTADAGLEVRVAVTAGTHAVSAAFLKKSAAAVEGPGPRFLSRSEAINEEDGEQMNLGSITVEGPFGGAATGPADTASRRHIFVCRPAGPADEESCARTILTTLARRAYRRPATDQDLELLFRLYRMGRADAGFDTGIQFALEALLVSPDFLLQVEQDPAQAAPGAVYRISDVALASRLSFFLWSSIPDDELLDLAVGGKLKDRTVLEQQVRRMLRDPRATTLVTNFVSQWLYLRDLRVAAPDTLTFPEWDDTLRQGFQRETEMFLDSQMRDDRPVMEMFTADYTFLNERLAQFYGVPNVYGSHFRRVKIADANRLGLLGHGSLLTVTSYSNRTSPVIRGQYVLTNLIGSPPAPPPPNVPTLKEAGEGGEAPTTVRARLEEHRKNAVCASCHTRMDPIGFALENFNGIGKWRTSEFNAPIDPTGVLPDGTKLGGVADLRTALMSHQTEIIQTFTGKLLTYALSRGVEYYDMPAVRKIARDASAGDYRWSSIILGIVNSTPFQMKIVQPEAPNPPSGGTVAATTPSNLR